MNLISNGTFYQSLSGWTARNLELLVDPVWVANYGYVGPGSALVPYEGELSQYFSFTKAGEYRVSFALSTPSPQGESGNLEVYFFEPESSGPSAVRVPFGDDNWHEETVTFKTTNSSGNRGLTFVNRSTANVYIDNVVVEFVSSDPCAPLVRELQMRRRDIPGVKHAPSRYRESIGLAVDDAPQLVWPLDYYDLQLIEGTLRYAFTAPGLDRADRVQRILLIHADGAATTLGRYTVLDDPSVPGGVEIRFDETQHPCVARVEYRRKPEYSCSEAEALPLDREWTLTKAMTYLLLEARPEIDGGQQIERDLAYWDSKRLEREPVIMRRPGVAKSRTTLQGRFFGVVREPCTATAEAPIADFAAVPTTAGRPSVDVEFINRTVNGTTFLWDFGDGQTSAEANPTHTYFSTGSYTVILTATGPGGTDSIARVEYIKIGVPQAGFTANPSTGERPLTVLFTNTTEIYEPEENLSWHWNFGNGYTSTLKNPSHQYTEAGQYLVTLRATGSVGFTEAVRGVTVTVPATAPTVDFTGVPNSGEVPLTVQFNALITGNYDSVEWDFGDGSPTVTTLNPQHEYTAEGQYSPVLTVKWTGGADVVRTKSNYITVSAAAAPIAEFESNVQQQYVNLPIYFTDLSTPAGEITAWLWDFNVDNPGTETSTDQNPNHTYTSAGSYTVSLTVTRAGATQDTETKVGYITVASYPAPVAAFVGVGPVGVTPPNGEAPLTVAFTDQSTNAESWAWQFGDTGTSSEQHPTHQYTSAGTYTVTLTVTGPGGSDPEVKTDYVTVTEPADGRVEGAIWSVTSSQGAGTTLQDEQASPYNLDLTGDYTWTTDDEGTTILRINSDSIAIGAAAATKIIDAIKASDELTIDLWARSDLPGSGLIERLLCLAVSASDINTEFQRRGDDSYAVRLKTTTSDADGDPRLQTGTLVVDGVEPEYLVMRRQTDGTWEILRDGNTVTPLAEGTRDGSTSAWSDTAVLALFDQVTGERPWTGDFYRAAIYPWALSDQEIAQNYGSGPNRPVPVDPIPPGEVPTLGDVTHYVDQATGNDNDDGTTPATAWATIDKANQTLVAGNVCAIRAGTYNEKIQPANSGTSSLPIAYTRYDGDALPVIGGVSGDATGRMLDINAKNYIYVYNVVLTWKHARPTTSDYSPTKVINSTGSVLYNCQLLFEHYDYTEVDRKQRIYDLHESYNWKAWGFDIVTSSAILVSNCVARGCKHGMHLKDVFSSVVQHNHIYDCWEHGIAFSVPQPYQQWGLLIQNNLVEWVCADGMQTPTATTNEGAYQGIIVRANIFRWCFENAVDFKTCQNVVFEQNLVYGIQGVNDWPAAGESDSQWILGSVVRPFDDFGSDIIIRNNLFLDTCQPIWYPSQGGVTGSAVGYKVYNNTIAGPNRTVVGANQNNTGFTNVTKRELALRQTSGSQAERCAFVNNIVAGGNFALIGLLLSSGADQYYDGNVYWDTSGGAKFANLTTNNNTYTIRTFAQWLSDMAAESQIEGQEANSQEDDPEFVSGTERPDASTDINDSLVSVPDDLFTQLDYRLGATSPAKNAGVYLTKAVGSGTAQSTITVEDATWFMDGFGITDGDTIRIGLSGTPVRILNISYASNVITLDGIRTWSDGDEVYMDFNNSAPDVGAYEADQV